MKNKQQQLKPITIEYALKTTWQLITNMYNEKAAAYDSTMAMGFTLLSIDAEGTPSTALGPKMGMEPTSLSRILNAMEERGYIERRPNPNDGTRRFDISDRARKRKKRCLKRNSD